METKEAPVREIPTAVGTTLKVTGLFCIWLATRIAENDWNFEVLDPHHDSFTPVKGYLYQHVPDSVFDDLQNWEVI